MNYDEEIARRIIVTKADETYAYYYDDKDTALADRKLFVNNLGVLLSQTREDILSMRLDDHDIVSIFYKNSDYVDHVNVHMDSYMAIVRDITKNI